MNINLKEAESHRFEAGCLMIDLSHKISNWKNVIKIIEPTDIYDDSTNEFGLELNPHVTILFGFDENVTSSDVHKLMDDEVQTNIPITLLGISIFPGGEKSEYDVVKFDIQSEELNRLHEICKTLPHHLSFPDYHPHMTIAYVKKGKGQRYVKTFKKPMDMDGNTFLFSNIKKQKSSWKIKKKYNFVIDLTKNK
jgi:2'-5' RNA ligase